jgi:hypothetical protein
VSLASGSDSVAHNVQAVICRADVICVCVCAARACVIPLCRFVLQRRMRVVTVPVAMAVTPREVFDGCDAEVVLAVLLHKLMQAAGKVCSLPSGAPIV